MRVMQSTRRRLGRLCVVLSLLVLAGCGSNEPFHKETVPVQGQVYIDGQPASSPVKLVCHDLKGMDQEHPSVSQSMTGQDGRFQISTYESGDGVPPGEYVLTFEWGQLNLFSGQYGGPDKLKGRYSDPKKSEFRFTVESSQPLDLGRIELTTE